LLKFTSIISFLNKLTLLTMTGVIRCCFHFVGLGTSSICI